MSYVLVLSVTPVSFAHLGHQPLWTRQYIDPPRQYIGAPRRINVLTALR
jgi:hypothetical protein